MVIEDHINMLGFGGKNPLVGPNDDRLGCRFPPLTNIYPAKNIVYFFNIIEYDF